MKNEFIIFFLLNQELSSGIYIYFFFQPPLKVCVANRNIGQIHLTKLFFYFYVFFLSVLYILSGAEQKNLGERGDPNKALRRVKGRRAPFPHFPLSMSSSPSKRRSCSSKALFDPLKGYPVTSFHSQIVPNQNVPLNSQIVPRYM